MGTYLLDADVFIRAKRDHYRFSTFPCFWDWIDNHSAQNVILSVEQVKDDLSQAQDDLATWVQTRSGIFLAADAATTRSLPVVAHWVSTSPRQYQQQAVSEFLSCSDYWLVANGHGRQMTVVTHEVPAPNSKKKVKIPDVCSGLGVRCITPFEMLDEMGARFP